MKKILFLLGVTILILGCSSGEIKVLEDKQTGDVFSFGRSKTIATVDSKIENDKQTTLTFVIGENVNEEEKAVKFIVTRTKKDSLSGKNFERKDSNDHYVGKDVIDDDYTIDIKRIRIANDGGDVFTRQDIEETEKEFHSLGIATGISFVYYNVSNEEIELLYKIYTSEKVYLYAGDLKGRSYFGEVTKKDEVIKMLEKMRE